MRLALVVLALVGGCKFRFDDTATADATDAPVIAIDAPPGHDEDGDGTPDVADNCPHVAGPLTDSDGDGVGDLCDPEPMNPRQTIVLFDPFVNLSGWNVLSCDWQPQGDAIRCDADSVYGELDRLLPFHYGVIELGTDVIARGTTGGQHQVTFTPIDPQAGHYHYVEAFEFNTSAGYASLSGFDGTNFTPIAQVPMMTGVHTGALTVKFVAAPTDTLGILVAWPGRCTRRAPPASRATSAVRTFTSASTASLSTCATRS